MLAPCPAHLCPPFFSPLPFEIQGFFLGKPLHGSTFVETWGFSLQPAAENQAPVPGLTQAWARRLAASLETDPRFEHSQVPISSLSGAHANGTDQLPFPGTHTHRSRCRGLTAHSIGMTFPSKVLRVLGHIPGAPPLIPLPSPFLVLLHSVPPFLKNYIIFIYLFIYFSFSRAAPMAYGGTQGRGLIGAVATALRQSHSNVGYEPCLQPTPQLTAIPDP